MAQENIRGVIFNIQRYSIHDGPGIRTTVFLKGCPLRCYWCQNPESQALEPEIFFDRGKCTRCDKCVAVCPTGASTLSTESSVIDRSICSGCGKCADVCPNDARKLVGRYISVDEVMHEVLKDARFYESSGGGVTLSGGDPTAQPSFALGILQRCKEVGLHTTLDTCGYAPWSTMEKLLEYTDLVLYDIKHMDSIRHKEGTGKSNSLILENAKRIARRRPMRIRVPLIPDFNDSLDEVRATARFVKAELRSVDVDLLPYNKFGEVKHERLDQRRISKEGRGEEYVRTLEDIVAQEIGEVIEV